MEDRELRLPKDPSLGPRGAINHRSLVKERPRQRCIDRRTEGIYRTIRSDRREAARGLCIGLAASLTGTREKQPSPSLGLAGDAAGRSAGREERPGPAHPGPKARKGAEELGLRRPAAGAAGSAHPEEAWCGSVAFGPSAREELRRGSGIGTGARGRLKATAWLGSLVGSAAPAGPSTEGRPRSADAVHPLLISCVYKYHQYSRIIK